MNWHLRSPERSTASHVGRETPTNSDTDAHREVETNVSLPSIIQADTPGTVGAVPHRRGMPAAVA